ncbi:MAG: hypothetical protein AAF648_04260, partial [Pseudomonadota bacterium]
MHQITAAKPIAAAAVARRLAGTRVQGLLLALMLPFAPHCLAGDPAASETGWRQWLNHRYLQAGVGTHWSDSDDHEGTPWLVGLELSPDDRRIAGISVFNNSFG